MRNCDRRQPRAMGARAWLLVLWVLASLFVACHSEGRLTAQEAEGKHLYAGRCAHCHEENDLNLKKVPPDLHRVFKSSRLPSDAPVTDADVRRVVLDGKGLMPGFAGRFTEEQM